MPSPFSSRFPSLSRRLDRWGAFLQRFWNSAYYFPLFTVSAALFLLCGGILPGLAVLLLSATLFLALSPDLLSALYPLLLLMLLSTRYYEENAVLYRLGWAVLIIPAALLLRLLRRHLPSRPGRFGKSLAAVSVATLLGGAGTITPAEYFSPVGLYYVLGLGLFLLLLYRLLRAELGRSQQYDPVRRFAAILYAAGLFTALLVIDRYLPYLDFFLREFQVIHIPCRNYFAAMLLLILPIPFYYLPENRLHALGAAVLAAAALLTGSRSALLFVPALGLICLLWYARQQGLSQRALAWLSLLLSAAALGLALLAAKTLFLSREIDGVLFSPEDSRIVFLRLALQDFLANPLTGQGLANMKNSGIFLGVIGSIVWYHNYVAQIIGSMGLVGLTAYGWQLRDRIRLLTQLRGQDQVLSLSYLGMLLISMTNPGEFSPLPSAALVIVLFAAAEEAVEKQSRV